MTLEERMNMTFQETDRGQIINNFCSVMESFFPTQNMKFHIVPESGNNYHFSVTCNKGSAYLQKHTLDEIIYLLQTCIIVLYERAEVRKKLHEEVENKIASECVVELLHFIYESIKDQEEYEITDTPNVLWHDFRRGA